MDKRMFAVFGLFLVAMIGCAYATDSADNTVTISDVNFTIPDGFTEDVSEAIVNETDSEDGTNYVTNGKTFENGDNYLLISVSEYEQPVTEDIIKDLGEKTTINNNVTGYFEDLGLLSLFTYIQDGKVVVVTSNDKNVIMETFN